MPNLILGVKAMQCEYRSFPKEALENKLRNSKYEKITEKTKNNFVVDVE